MKISVAEFESLAEDAFSNIPAEFRERLDNIEIVIDNKPRVKAYRDRGFNLGRLLGLYHGVPLRRRGVFYSNALPDRITLYKDNIESACGNKEELSQMIKDVLWHEVGHYFGLSEKELRDIERRQAR